MKYIKSKWVLIPAILSSFIIISLIAIFLSFQAPNEFAGTASSLQDIASYYESVSKETIARSSGHEASETLYLKDRDNYSVYDSKSALQSEIVRTQSLLKFDIDKFIKYQDADDLRTAKIKYISDLKFDNGNFQYTRAYRHLSSWGTLFHPPSQQLDTSISKVDSAWSNRLPFSSTQYSQPSFQQKLDRITTSALTSGNRLTILENGQTLGPVLKLIEESSLYLFIQMLAIDCKGSSAKKITDKLIAKAKSGVDVRMLIDKLYSNLSSSCIHDLKKGGVIIVTVGGDKMLKPAQHSSVYLNDKSHMIIGAQSLFWGFYESTGTNFLDRDTSASVIGPATTDALGEFLYIWEHHRAPEQRGMTVDDRDQPIDYEKVYKKLLKRELSQGVRGASNYNMWLNSNRPKELCRFVAQRPQGAKRDLQIALKEHALVAKKSISGSSVKYLYSEEEKLGAREIIEILQNRAKHNVRVDLFGNGFDGGNGELTIEFERLLSESQKRKYQLTKQNLGGLRLMKENFIIGLLQHFAKKAKQKHARINFEQYKRILSVPNLTVWTNFNFTHHKTWEFDKNVFAITSLLISDESYDNYYDSGIICMDAKAQKSFEKGRALDIINSVPYTSISLK